MLKVKFSELGWGALVSEWAGLKQQWRPNLNRKKPTQNMKLVLE